MVRRDGSRCRHCEGDNNTREESFEKRVDQIAISSHYLNAVAFGIVKRDDMYPMGSNCIVYL